MTYVVERKLNSTYSSIHRSYRYAAYRQLSWFTYTKLGRYVRRIIPSCVVNIIRQTFPEPDGSYTNFVGEFEIRRSETEEAWEYHKKK